MRTDRRLLGFLLLVLLVLAVVHEAGDDRFDFGGYYFPARMVLDGARTSLYDIQAQQAFQLRYHRPPELLFYSPAFVLLPFLPLAPLPISAAYLLWTALSIGLLTASVRSLARRTGLQYDNWPLLASLGFMPVASCLAHGQLSIVVLAAYIWCYALWSDGRRFAGGAVLALACFKFQLATGFVCVLLLKRKWRELAGFAVGAAPLLILTIVIAGPKQFLHYPQFLLAGEASKGVDPVKMASLRGMIALLTGRSHLGEVVLLSAAVVLIAAWLWNDLDSGFSAALLAGMLVSYHFNPQDLSLAIIPLCIAGRQRSSRALAIWVTAALALPLIAFAAGGYFAILAIPLVGALMWVGTWKPQAGSALCPIDSMNAIQ
jgi:hypothetical protein